jgi:hypothetical protein
VIKKKYRTPYQSLVTSTSKRGGKSSPFDSRTVESTGPSQQRRTRGRKSFIPIKAAVEMTDRARTFFTRLLANPPRAGIVGIRLNYEQSRTGEPRMVFSFEFVTQEDLLPDDEPVSLELVTVVDKRDGSTRSVPKTPRESWHDGRPKLFVSTNAFFKVLGATVDVDSQSMNPILYDKEGNIVDPSV